MAATTERNPLTKSRFGEQLPVGDGDSSLSAPDRRTGALSELMQYVLEFHRVFGLDSAATPRQSSVSAHLAELRIDLLFEEVQEFADAARNGDLVAIADALADIAYVTYGAAITYGIDLDAVLREVHSSNMSKLGPDGRPVLRSDGKVLKPRSYRPPNVEAVLDVQLPLHFNDR